MIGVGQALNPIPVSVVQGNRQLNRRSGRGFVVVHIYFINTARSRRKSEAIHLPDFINGIAGATGRAHRERLGI